MSRWWALYFFLLGMMFSHPLSFTLWGLAGISVWLSLNWEK